MCDDAAWTHSFIAAFNSLTKPSLRVLIQFVSSSSNIFIMSVLKFLLKLLIMLYIIYVDILVCSFSPFIALTYSMFILLQPAGRSLNLAALTDTVNSATLEHRSRRAMKSGK